MKNVTSNTGFDKITKFVMYLTFLCTLNACYCNGGFLTSVGFDTILKTFEKILGF